MKTLKLLSVALLAVSFVGSVSAFITEKQWESINKCKTLAEALNFATICGFSEPDKQEITNYFTNKSHVAPVQTVAPAATTATATGKGQTFMARNGKKIAILGGSALLVAALVAAYKFGYLNTVLESATVQSLSEKCGNGITTVRGYIPAMPAFVATAAAAVKNVPSQISGIFKKSTPAA